MKHSLGAEPETAVGVFRFRPSAAYRAATALRNWGPVRDNWVRMRKIIGDLRADRAVRPRVSLAHSA
jgi:hypothetical protein